MGFEQGGRSEAEKKTVLRRIVDFFDRIIEAIKETIQNGELSKTAREFAQMQADKATEIRKMFLEALDGINGKKRENAESETKDSRKRVDFDEKIDKDKGKAHNKKRLYNEADTIFMQWSNSPSVPVGERKMFKRGKEWALFKKTKDGRVEMYRGKYKKEVMYYGQTYAETDTSYDEDIEEIGIDTGRDLRNLFGIGNEENVGGHGRPIKGEGLQIDSEGNSEHLRPGVRGILDVTDSEVKNSLKLTDSEGNELSEEQRKFFENSKVRDEDGNLLVVYHGTDADFTVFDRTKGRSSMDIQGSFFSPWELDASGYGADVKAYCLDIKNPASEGVVMVIAFSLPKFLDFLTCLVIK